MAIILCDVLDNEILRAIEMEGTAYKTNNLLGIFTPGPFPVDSRERRAEQFIKTRRDDQTVVYMQAIDQDTDQMIAFAKWHVLDKPQVAADFTRTVPSGPGMNQEACDLFFGGLNEKQKQLMGGRPRLCAFNFAASFFLRRAHLVTPTNEE